MSNSSGRDGQFHFDSGTYLELDVAEGALYAELERRTAEATAGVSATSILDLRAGAGAGAGETLAATTCLAPEVLATLECFEPLLHLAQVVRYVHECLLNRADVAGKQLSFAVQGAHCALDQMGILGHRSRA